MSAEELRDALHRLVQDDYISTAGDPRNETIRLVSAASWIKKNEKIGQNTHKI